MKKVPRKKREEIRQEFRGLRRDSEEWVTYGLALSGILRVEEGDIVPCR